MTGGGQPCGEMDVLEKLTILTDAAKYDAACTSSGGNRRAKAGYIGNTTSSIAGCCHSFSADGRCVTLLKVLMTNRCVYDCKYCVNRRSNEAKRAMFTPEELADLTIQFYRRNYIEGLFLSSGVYRSPDYTTELMIRALRILREEYRFNGYIHAKAIPGTAPELVEQMGFLADRLSVNIELPSEAGLRTLAPDKTKQAILAPMGQIRVRGQQSREELVKYRHAPRFAPAGQSTQLIVGATADTDFHILRLTQGLYDRYQLKRVFYSAYVPVVEHALLPAKDTKPPLLREHRLYQADWLLRFYGFRAAGCKPSGLQPPGGSQVQLGPPAPGLLPGGGEPGGLRGPAADPRRGRGLRQAHSGVPPGPEAADRGSAQAGGGDEAGPVFSHRLRPHGRRPAVHTGQPAAESDRGGAALPAPTGAGADVPVCPCVREVPHDRDDL